MGILFYIVSKRTRTSKTKEDVKSPKTKIRITVAFKNLRRKIPARIHFNAENSINYHNLLKNIRMRLQIKPTQSIYLFSNGRTVHPNSTWSGGRVRILCTGEHGMGGDE